jgi:translation elongation factor EF-1alpha
MTSPSFRFVVTEVHAFQTDSAIVRGRVEDGYLVNGTPVLVHIGDGAVYAYVQSIYVDDVAALAARRGDDAALHLVGVSPALITPGCTITLPNGGT